MQALRHERHLDQPIPVQYWEYVREVAHGNLGNSLYSNRPVREDIAQYLPATLELIFTAAAMIVLIGIPVGVLSARYRGRLGDHLGRLGSIMGVSTPAFVWGVILQLVFAYFWRLFPIEGRLTATLPPPPASHRLLPCRFRSRRRRQDAHRFSASPGAAGARTRHGGYRTDRSSNPREHG